MIFFIAPSLLASLSLQHNLKIFKQFLKKILSRSNIIDLTANSRKESCILKHTDVIASMAISTLCHYDRSGSIDKYSAFIDTRNEETAASSCLCA